MNFTEIARARQSCRSYDPERPVEQEKLDAILEAVRLSPASFDHFEEIILRKDRNSQLPCLPLLGACIFAHYYIGGLF